LDDEMMGAGCRSISRREAIKAAGIGAAGLGLVSMPAPLRGLVREAGEREGPPRPPSQARPFPRTEEEGGWSVATPEELGVDPARLAAALGYHDGHVMTTSYGGALLVVYKGHLIGESYTTGTEGGPQPWTARTCNDMKSSTKSVFGTAAGVFLDEYRDRVTLDSLLVGSSREESLIPQIWDQPLTDERKTRIKVKHALSMTSGHETREPWLAPTTRRRYPGYSGPHQMYEYCFGWWHFDDIPAHHTLRFEPGSEFNYSNYGLEQLALAMRNISGERVGPYLYDRVLRHIGVSPMLRDSEYGDMPYADDRELNFADTPGWGIGGGAGCDAYGADPADDSPIGINSVVGSTLRCTARDFARIAYLWLNEGRWEGRQLVPADWIRLATSRYQRDDGASPVGYGYTFWVRDEVDQVPADLYMSRGHNQNHSYVIPSLDLVVVRQGNRNRQPPGEPNFESTVIQRIVAALPRAEG
jgi:CubicO group peptidase (beta-lactamase class C family)